MTYRGYGYNGPDRSGKDAKRVQFRLSADEHDELMEVARQYGKPVTRWAWRGGKSVKETTREPATMSEIVRQALAEYVSRYKTAALPGMEKPKRKPAAKKKAVTK